MTFEIGEVRAVRAQDLVVYDFCWKEPIVVLHENGREFFEDIGNELGLHILVHCIRSDCRSARCCI